jgi:hypothetical protein
MSVDVNRRGGAGGSTEPPKAAGSAADGGKGAGAGAGDGAGAGGDGATADSPASVAAGAGLAGARRSSAAGAARGVVGSADGSETPVGEESKAVSSLAMRASVDGNASVIRSEARGVLSEASGSGESWSAAAADSAEASRTDSLPVPGKRPGGVNRDVLPSWAGLIGREDSGNCSGVCRVADRVGYRSIVAGGVATGDSGGLKPRSLKPWSPKPRSLRPRSLRPRSLSLMARGGFASVPGWGKGPGSRRRSPSPTGTEAACDTTDGSVIPAERPRPIAQTRPKPVPAQTMAPSASGRLECL